MPNIRFINATLYYGTGKQRIDVVPNLNICFFDQKINVLLGESGGGKTTILKSLVDIVEHDGQILLDDIDIDRTLINKRGVSYVSQNMNLYPHMTIFDNIAFPLKMRKCTREEILTKTRAIAERLNIDVCLNVRGKYLSIGQQQRAMLARELVSGPKILLMDEPFSNLDPILRREMCKLVKELAEEYHFTVIFVTHSYTEAINLGDYLFVLEEGKIVASGPMKKMLDSNNEYLENMRKNDYVNLSDIDEKKKIN